MTTASLLELKKTTTPQQFSQELQTKGEIFWWEPGNFFVITAYDLAKKVLRSDRFSCDRTPFFLSRMPNMNLALVKDFFAVISRMMVMSDDRLHQQRRRICYEGFSNSAIAQLVPTLKKALQISLKPLLNGEEIDFVSAIAKQLPSTTLAEFFAIPDQDREPFYQASYNMTQFFGGSTRYFDEDGLRVNASACYLQQYFSNLLNERKKYPGTDFFSSLLCYQEQFGLSDDDIISQAIMMLVAGQITTTDQICNNLFFLLSHPPLWEELVKNPNSLSLYLEECNRHDPAVSFIFRVCRRKENLLGLEIEPGQVIFISTHAVNRCPKTFIQPHQFNPFANHPSHFSYGFGQHFCLGAKLARLEMELLFTELIDKAPKLRLSESLLPERSHHSLAFSGFARMFIGCE